MSASAAPVRVLVADDQKVVRDGLSLLIGMLPGVEVIGTAVDGTDAVRQAAACAPDVVLMDLSMPNCDGVEATRRIVRQQPYIRVVVLTAFSDHDSVFAAPQAGPAASSPRTPAPARFSRRYRRSARGDVQLDPSVQGPHLDERKSSRLKTGSSELSKFSGGTSAFASFRLRSAKDASNSPAWEEPLHPVTC